jgi:pilus assembly protein Flp/PilA
MEPSASGREPLAHTKATAGAAECTQIEADESPNVSEEINMSKFLKLMEHEEGATAIEYGLIAALIVVAGIVGVTNLGSGVGANYNATAAAMNSAVEV